MAKKKAEKDSGENNPNLEEMETDKKGNTFLPGTAPKVIKAIVEQVKEIENILKPQFAKTRDALVAGKDNLARLAHENIQHFSPPDEDGERVYKAGGVIVKITFEKEKVEGKIEKDEI